MSVIVGRLVVLAHPSIHRRNGRVVESCRNAASLGSEQIGRFVNKPTPWHQFPQPVAPQSSSGAAPGQKWPRRHPLAFAAVACLAGLVLGASSVSSHAEPAATVTSTVSATVTATATSTVTAPAPTVTVTETSQPEEPASQQEAPDPPVEQVTAQAEPQVDEPASESAYYANCTAARAAGAAPIYIGEPGCRPALDRDGDGIACE